MKKLSLSAMILITAISFVQEVKAQVNNTSYGSGALYFNTGESNSAFGVGALEYNSSGNNNTAIGAYVLYFNKTGSNNTGTGEFSLANNDVGNFNTAYGARTLTDNGNGYNNTAVGFEALTKNRTGNRNTALGYDAMFSNTTGHNNTGAGLYALFSNTTGRYNTANGNYSLRYGTSGSYNTAVGYNAGSAANYNNSTFLGYGTTASSSVSNVTVLGYGASATASNQVRIGNTSVTSIGGKVSWSTLSDGRFKKNITDDVPGLAFISKLKPVSYTLDIKAIDKASGIGDEVPDAPVTAGQAASREKHTGFVAQDVEKAAKEIKYDFSGLDKPKNDKDFYGLRYAEFVVPLVKAVQELSTENKQLKEDLAELRQMVMDLKINRNTNASPLSSAYLKQNIPNPASGSTAIPYYIPASTSSAKIAITNTLGQLVENIKIINKGFNQVNINITNLPPGTYNYSLWENGKQLDTKQLIINK